MLAFIAYIQWTTIYFMNILNFGNSKNMLLKDNWNISIESVSLKPTKASYIDNEVCRVKIKHCSG